MTNNTTSFPNHDRARRLLFAHRDVVEDLLRHHVQETWIEELDLTTLRREPEISISEPLDARESDIVWSVHWRERYLYVLILLEFQSSVDRWLALRQLVYVALFYQKLVQAGRLEDGKLPPVFPIVIYNGKPRWTAPLDLRDLVAEAPGELARYQPTLRYFLVDELRMAVDLNHGRELLSAIAALERSEDRRELVTIVDRLSTWLDSRASASERRAFAAWLSRVLLPRHNEHDDGSIEELLEFRSMLAETVERWRREDRAKELQIERKDRQLARRQRLIEQKEELIERTKTEAADARRQGEIEVLRRQFTRKFGALDDATIQRLEDADDETLLRWSERLLAAASLDEVFAED
ncbi:MAG: Rpn family recombination-promoting nuclease/putative transposase [Acidobacteriota bacterium]